MTWRQAPQGAMGSSVLPMTAQQKSARWLAADSTRRVDEAEILDIGRIRQAEVVGAGQHKRNTAAAGQALVRVQQFVGALSGLDSTAVQQVGSSSRFSMRRLGVFNCHAQYRALVESPDPRRGALLCRR